MKRSLLIKLGLLVGMTAGVEANAQVFNASDIYNADFYGYGGAVYNAMPLGQGAYADPGNNIWNGFACPNGPGSTAVFGGGRPNDFLLPGNPGNPYAWAVTNGVPFFSTGSQLLNPANYSSWSYANFPFANATSAGAVSPITIPFIDFTYYTWDNAGLDTGGTSRTNVALTMLSACILVNTSAPGAGTTASPKGEMVLSNVPPGTYDLFLYGANPGGTRGASFAVSSGTPIYGISNTINPNAVAGSTGLTNFVLGGDFTIFNYVTPNADSSIHISWGAVSNYISGLSGEGDYNGLQLVPSTPAPAFLVAPPASATFAQGATATVITAARGNPGLAYQWYKGTPPSGTAVVGQTNHTLALTNVTLSEAGSYYCVATNINGTATSSVATLTIIAAPTILTQTTTTDTNAVSLYSGHNHFGISVTAIGDVSHPWSFYWESNGVATAVTSVSATNGLLAGTYNWVNITGSATYSCVVSNAYGTAATTNDIDVTIVPAPANPYASAMLALNPFAYWPLNETSVGATYDYVGGVNGTPTATADYQVGQPGPVTGFGASSLAYAFDGTESAVDVPSAYVNFTGPMTIITWVEPQTYNFETVAGKGDSSYRIDVDANGVAHFNDAGPGDVQGGPDLNAGQWHQIVGTYNGTIDSIYVDGNLVSSQLNDNTLGGNGDDLYIGGAPDYTGRFIVGSVAQVALLTNALSAAQVEALFKAGQTPLFIAAQPASTTGYLGGDATFSVTATGGNPITYQWSGPAGPIAGATNATLVLTNLSENTAVNSGPGTYYCTITNPESTTNTVEDGSVALTVDSSSPFFVQDLPTTFYGLAGTTIVLPVVEAGNPTITNQWFYSATTTPPTTALHNGGRISGAQSETLAISDAQPSDAGYYQVLATNGVAPYVGSSQVAQLVIEPTLGFNDNGAGWTPNGVANINGNVLELTDGGGGEASTEFFNTPLYVGAFEASFTYTAVGGADGATFCIQNSPAGTASVGTDGGSLGYTGIPDSVALAFDLYTANPGGIEFVTDGSNPNNGIYTKVTPISFVSGDPINVTLNYNGQTLGVNLVDTVTAGVFTTNLTVGPITQYVGTNVALVGFTGGTGGVTSTQTIGNFNYIPLPLLTATHTGTNVVVTWPSAVGGYVLQEASSLTSPSWTTVAGPYTTSGANNQVTVPAISGNQFFRLYVP